VVFDSSPIERKNKMTPEENFRYCLNAKTSSPRISKEFQFECKCGATLGLKKRIVQKTRSCPCCGSIVSIEEIDRQTQELVQYLESNRWDKWMQAGQALLACFNKIGKRSKRR
jgi:hypothetical protein